MGAGKTVVVAMSGGVDSSVAAALLKEAGYNVIGVFMRNWGQAVNGICPWAEDQKDMRKVCDKLNIPSYTFNFEKEYYEKVVEYFFEEYASGRTPNPDVMCNKEIKFDVFRRKAKELGGDYIATGHYARVIKDESSGLVHLYKGLDGEKDQSYFLWLLGQEELSDILFPVGEMTKQEVRKLAKKFGLPTAGKKDSQGICFIGLIKVRKFLKTRIDAKPGPVALEDGSVIAQHEGVYFYTIGQRLGVDRINWPDGDIPVLYVKDKILKTNTLVVSGDSSLYACSLICDNIHWIAEKPKLPCNFEVAIRYGHKPRKALLASCGNGKIKVSFQEPQRAITPGQSAVFYNQDKLIGGGIISGSK
ncbi:MAG: tRNA 2-thiouridine(34) synthase MnmA [bacterium]|nr:tRNA 2-thiouridine(34) synthase MnmA [bacterium]